MSAKTDAIIKLAVAMGYGASASDYSGKNTEEVLREVAVKMQCAASTGEIRAFGIVELLNYMADNYGSEEREPYNLTKTETHATVTFKRKGKTLNVGNDILYNGDKIKITATAESGYELTTLTVNGTAFTSGNEYTVNGHNVAVVATGTEL